MLREILIFSAVAGAAVLLLPYVAGPILIWINHRRSSAPTIVPCEPQSMPPPAAAFFDRVGPAVADLGFAEACRFTMRDFIPGVVVDFLTLVNRPERTVALATVAAVLRGGAVRRLAMSLEFATRFTDDTQLLVTNTSTLFAHPVPGKTIVQVPEAQDPGTLLAVYRSVLRRERGLREQKDPPPRESIPGSFRENIARDLRAQASAGWIRPVPGGAAWRLTIRGACGLAWGLLWPVKSIRAARMRARGRAVMSQTSGPAGNGPP